MCRTRSILWKRPARISPTHIFAKLAFVAGPPALRCGWESLATSMQREASLDYLEAATLSAYELGKRMTPSEVMDIPAALNAICRAVAPFFEKYDVLLTPTTSRPAQPLGTYNQNATGITTEQWFDHKGSFAPFLALFNMTGQPAFSVPLAMSSDGLPLGMHFVGRFGAEPVLFRLAAQLEKARPWTGRRPSL